METGDCGLQELRREVEIERGECNEPRLRSYSSYSNYVIIRVCGIRVCSYYCKSTNFGVLLYLANLANCVFSQIFVTPTYVNYVDRTLHRRGDAKFNSRQITLF